MSNPIKHTSQAIDNWSFDESYQQAAVEILTENVGGTALVRQKPIATEDTLLKINEFGIPTYDTMVVDSTNSNSIVITYKKNSSTVATKTITTAGAVVTTTVTFP